MSEPAEDLHQTLQLVPDTFLLILRYESGDCDQDVSQDGDVGLDGGDLRSAAAANTLLHDHGGLGHDGGAVLDQTSTL